MPETNCNRRDMSHQDPYHVGPKDKLRGDFAGRDKFGKKRLINQNSLHPNNINHTDDCLASLESCVRCFCMADQAALADQDALTEETAVLLNEMNSKGEAGVGEGSQEAKRQSKMSR